MTITNLFFALIICLVVSAAFYIASTQSTERACYEKHFSDSCAGYTKTETMMVVGRVTGGYSTATFCIVDKQIPQEDGSFLRQYSKNIIYEQDVVFGKSYGIFEALYGTWDKC